MYFKVSWDEDFDTLMMHLWGKYGKEMFTMDGIGEQMDMNKFSQDFFNKGHSPTTDVSVDGNANVTQRTSIEYNHELPKPMRRYNSYFLLWKQLKKDVGLEFANRIIEAQLNGDIYINDFTDIALPYSYHPGTTFIVKSGDVIQKVTMEGLFSLYREFTQYLNDREQIDIRRAKLQVLDMKDGKPRWTDLKCILRHKSHTKLKNVTVANGSVFTVTTDHPCILDDWSEKKADELVVGDNIMGMAYDAALDFICNSGIAHVDYTSGGVDSSYAKPYNDMLTITIGNDNSVVEITDIPYIGEWVYDITTESGHFYSNGSIVHNCFNYSTYDIALEGLVGVSERPIVKAPKSLDTFIRQVEQFMVIAANSTLGATGFADILIVASHFVRKIMETGYDGHVYIGTDIERVKTYVKEKLTEFIYTVNWSFRGNQCVTEDTEVLTPFGFKGIDELKIDDPIYTWRDGKLNVQTVKKVNIYDYDGEMHEYKGMDVLQVVTPNHRVLYKGKRGEFKLTESSSVKENNSFVTIPIAMENENSDVLMSNDWVDFIALMMLNGQIYRNDGDIHVLYEKGVLAWGDEYLEELVNRLDLDYDERGNELIFDFDSSDFIFDTVGSSLNFPDWVSSISGRQAERIINTWHRAYGTIFDGRIALRYRTDEEADNLQHLCLLAGYGSKKTNGLVLIIPSRETKANSIESVHYKGRVWCPTTDDGIVVFRKDGKVFISGNSPFSNLSVFDNTFLNSLCPDYVLFERPADPEIVKMIQEIYIDAMNDELSRTPLTFPVTTACFCTDKNGEIDDTEFVKVIAEKNLKYGFINIYCGKSSTLSSCCFNGEQKVHVLLHGSRSGQDMSFKELVKVTEGYPYLMAKYEGYWYPAKVIKLKYTGKMYHIILEGGRDMICTPDHIHVAYGGEKYSAELTMNDYIRVREKADGVDAYMVEKGEKVDKLYEKIKYIGVIEKNEDGYVYCLEMEDSTNPYFQLSNGVITHNCRLRSESDNPYMNSFGAGSTKIGSLGVVTVNFPRAAMKAVAEAEANHDPETKERIFMEQLRNLFDYECLINQAKREIVSKRIELGAAPLYTHGYMDLKKQYSTFGVVGLNEAVSILGYDILTEEGQEFVTRVLKTMNEWIKCAENQYKAPHNAEAVPAESSAVKLANKDKMLGYDCGVPFYSNQFIPLTVKANLLDRIRLQGKFDNLFSGGAICHVNVDTEITNPEQIEELIKYAAKKGVVYWAINYRLNYCKNKHGWVGSHKCPVCGGDAEETITRVVGFFTNVKNWNKTRREHDWPNRQFYKSIV